MDQRVSLITLGVRDPNRAAAFYEALGWTRVEAPEGIVVFDLIGQSLGLYPLEDLARDMGVKPERLGTGAATYAYNVRDKVEVAQVLDTARAAGAEILKEAHDVFWGGHIGYFSDPEGHVWEVAWNPFSPLSDEGTFRWGGYASGEAG
ncbi:VOC family protein [Marimonas arenosa]|uniref:VOC family protein n=1 Tax=Marimonas arenosa TaxID=1795305 RepID=A0AAE3WB64_9RHOB|nr:VOC family protein [Marimonas arenosa]MDQ2089235.1 VOC family protein [Marimonas arenosa]